MILDVLMFLFVGSDDFVLVSEGLVELIDLGLKRLLVGHLLLLKVLDNVKLVLLQNFVVGVELLILFLKAVNFGFVFDFDTTGTLHVILHLFKLSILQRLVSFDLFKALSLLLYSLL